MNKKWKEPLVIIGIITVIVMVIGIFKVSENPNSIANSDIKAPVTQVEGDVNAPITQVNGDININKALPQRSLNSSERLCLLQRINKFEIKKVVVQLETVPIRQNGTSTDGYYDSLSVGVNNEVRNFADEIITYLRSENFEVSSSMGLGNMGPVAKGITISSGTSSPNPFKTPDVEKRTLVLIGENDGTNICE